MMNVYITKQGDTWDSLALFFWGSEYLLTDLVEANQKYRHYIDFPEGIELVVPDVEIDDESDVPEWLAEELDDMDLDDEVDADDENNEIN